MRPAKGSVQKLGNREVRFNPARGSGGDNKYRPSKGISPPEGKAARFNPKSAPTGGNNKYRPSKSIGGDPTTSKEVRFNPKKK